MTIYVTVDQTYMKQVTGLCGTYTNRCGGKRCGFFFIVFILIQSSRWSGITRWITQ